ncbi:MAG: hypothetical protein ACHQFZ_09000 [Acidimicrobiales bacterium]
MTATSRARATRWRRGVAGGALALAALCGVAGAATSTAPPVLATAAGCSAAYQARPTQVVLACADDNAYLGDLRWSAWTATRGVGAGEYMLNRCVPNCAASSVKPVGPVTVVASRPVTNHGVTFFTRLLVTLTRSKLTETLHWIWASAPGVRGYWTVPVRGGLA